MQYKIYLMARQEAKRKFSSANIYDHFDRLDGSHPFKKAAPESFIEYHARKRHGGKVVFFHFDLAKEMGLIPKDHSHEMNKKLEKKILETFAIQIINEYDQIHQIDYPKGEIVPGKFMATRYLQLQHPNKQGKTSGDGRSIWNGVVKNKGRTWDVTSCGTGATRLSPATAINKKFYKNGDPSISYGCGWCERDEGLETLFFSEVLDRNGMGTERVLAIIEFEKGISINIRAHDNLIRPSHMFNHMKQGEYEALKNVVDYYIDRQVKNKKWANLPINVNEKYQYFLEKQIEVFAEISARFEDEYIFCWLDWDGDNILMDGGILDYGSVRQFGLYHHEYRFDDVERFSTNIKEQKSKAKYTVQTFAQIVDFLKTGKKKSISKFRSGTWAKSFEKIYRHHKKKNLLAKIGFTDEQVRYLEDKHHRAFKDFERSFRYFETATSTEGLIEVEDGITKNAIFCMRDILRELPQFLLNRNEGLLECEEFINIIKSSYALPEDLEISDYRRKMILQFQKKYLSLIRAVAKGLNKDRQQVLLNLTMRSSVINKFDRITGDSITTIVYKVAPLRNRLGPEGLYALAQELREYQSLDPADAGKSKLKREQEGESKVFKGVLKIVREMREGL